MKNYIGLDAHSTSCTFVVVNDKGQETFHQKVMTSEFQLLRVVRSISGKKALTFEEGNMSQWLYVLLKSEVDELLVCNPVYVFRRKGPKNDYEDSLHLAQQLRGGFLTPVHKEESELNSLRSIVSGYEDLIREITKNKNRFKAILMSEGISAQGQRVYNDEASYNSLKDKSHQFVAKQIFDHLQFLKSQQKLYLKQFSDYVNSNNEIKVLTTIPGMAEIRSCIAAALICSPKRFQNKYHFWSYCMLVRHNEESNDKVVGKIRKFGRTALKNIYMGAAQSALLTDNHLKDEYESDLKSGLNKKAAKKNLARKIAAISLALMKNGKAFENKTGKKNIEK